MSPKTRALVLLGLVAFAAVVAAPARAAAAEEEEEDFGDEDAAFLVVRKSMADESPAFVGKAATVTIEIFNAGQSAARAIKLDDSAPLPDGLALAPGADTTASFAKLDVGATARHSYDLVAASGGRAFKLPRASLTYLPFDGSKEAPKQARSSSPVVYVETPVEAAARHVLTAGAYGTLGLVKTPAQWRSVAIWLVLGGTVFGGSAVVGKAKAATAAQRRTKALAALEKEK